VNEEALVLSESDEDGDGLSALAEQVLGLNDNSADTDGDGMTDGFELANGFDPLDNLNPSQDTNPDDNAGGDADGDGRTNAQEAADGTNPNDPLDESIQIAGAKGITKTKVVPANTPAEERVVIFHQQSYRISYPEGNTNPAFIAGSESLDAFGVLEGMTLVGYAPGGSEVSSSLGGAAIENSLTSDELGKQLPEESLSGAVNIRSFLNALERDASGYVQFEVTFTSTANLDEEDDSGGDGPGGDGGGGAPVGGSGGGYGGGAAFGYSGDGNLSGLRPYYPSEPPLPRGEPIPEKEELEVFKAKANSPIVVFTEAAAIQLTLTSSSGKSSTGEDLNDPLNCIVMVNDDYDEGLTDPNDSSVLLPDNSNDVTQTSDDELGQLEITVHTSTPGEGQFSLGVPGGIKAFDSNGDLIPSGDFMVDFANPNPQGALASLASGSAVTIYFEGISTAEDLHFTASLDGLGADAFPREAHFALLKVDLTADPGKIHLGFDPPNLDPASGENDDPSVYWASVVQGSTNNIVNLNIPGGDFSNFEWIKHSGDGATVTHDETASGGSTDLTITATGSGSAIQEPEFHLVVKGSTQRLLTLNVMVLPSRGPISLGVYHIEDSTSNSTLFASAPSVSKADGQSIVTVCNDVFLQAGVSFELDVVSSGDYDVPYDTKLLFWDESNTLWTEFNGKDGDFSTAELNSGVIPSTHSYPADIDLFYLKKSARPYELDNQNSLFIRGVGGSPTLPEMYLCVSDSSSYVELATAHEIGHILDLSTANDPDSSPGSSDHDNPPYPPQVAEDLQNLIPPTAPANHTGVPNAALMQSGWPEQNKLRWPWGRWMRHEDWREANENAANL